MSEVKTVFKGTKSSFIKAMIYQRDEQAFLDLGFVASSDFLPEEQKKEKPIKEKPSKEKLPEAS